MFDSLNRGKQALFTLELVHRGPSLLGYVRVLGLRGE